MDLRFSRGRRDTLVTIVPLVLPSNDYPMRALLLVHVKTLAVIAADTLSHDDLRPVDGAPLTRFFTDLARVALRPSLDAEDGELRQQPERRAERAQESTVEIPDEDGCDQHHAERNP